MAWNDPRGHISIRFNAYVAIDTADPDVCLTLFPNDGDYHRADRELPNLEDDPIDGARFEADDGKIPY